MLRLSLLSAQPVVAVVAVVDGLEYHYCTYSCLYDSCIVAAPVRTDSSEPLPDFEYTEGDRGPFEIVQDGTGDRANKSEYHHRDPHQKLKAVPTFYYSTLSNST